MVEITRLENEADSERRRNEQEARSKAECNKEYIEHDDCTKKTGSSLADYIIEHFGAEIISIETQSRPAEAYAPSSPGFIHVLVNADKAGGAF